MRMLLGLSSGILMATIWTFDSQELFNTAIGFVEEKVCTDLFNENPLDVCGFIFENLQSGFVSIIDEEDSEWEDLL